jgi:AcrR family transcriptional regulator
MASASGNADDQRERLVTLARAIIEERGGSGLTMHELAARAGISPAVLGRYFDGKDALMEAVAEFWFRPKVAIMEEVLASDLPPRRKMYEFFARRFISMRKGYDADPTAFRMYVEIGEEHFEQVRSYVDLADHYLGVIIGEAMGEGFFPDWAWTKPSAW